MFDLQLDRIKTGAQICTIFPDGMIGGLYIVGEYSVNHGKYRYNRIGEDRNIGLLPLDGCGYYAMQSRDKPHFYFSANPEHVQATQSKMIEAESKAKEKLQSDKVKLDELQKKIKGLLKEYNASLDAVQTSGDDQGVEIELQLSIGSRSIVIE